jgi:lysozyme family protein
MIRTAVLIVSVGVVLSQCAGAITPAHDALQVKRWQSASIPQHKRHAVAVVAKRILDNQARYKAVAERTSVPWYTIAGLHNMEASGSFSKHLHEGSPLSSRTRWVPKGRPKTGSPPFTWEYSAEDALNYDRMSQKNWAKLGPALSACEGYNGWGYAKWHPATPTPYLWACTSAERPGRYVADSKWSATARSAQVGVAAVWKQLEEWGYADIPKP